MSEIGQAALDVINETVLRRYGDGERFVPERNLNDAYAFSKAMREHVQQITDAIAVLNKYVLNSQYAPVVVAELAAYHSTEIDQLGWLVGRAVAAKDPTKYDERFSPEVNALADRFRS